MSKPKTLKYRVSTATDVKEFRRHKGMKKYVRTLDPQTTQFRTEYWSGRIGVNGGYLPSWEWSTEGQMQYQAKRAAHLARKAEHTASQAAAKEKAKADRTAKIASKRVARAQAAKAAKAAKAKV